MYFVLLFLPFVLLLGTFALTRNKRLAYRIIWTGIVTAVTFPIGFMILTIPSEVRFHLTHREPNPGQGIVGVPLAMGSLMCLGLWALGTVLALVYRAIRSHNTSN
jgi:hypothetical protein